MLCTIDLYLLSQFRVFLQVSQCLRYGAKVEQHGDNIAESKEHAMKLAQASKLKYING